MAVRHGYHATDTELSVAYSVYATDTVSMGPDWFYRYLAQYILYFTF
jgi:hypothetical protein